MNEPAKPTGQPATSTESKEPVSVAGDKHGLLKFVVSLLTVVSFLGEARGVPHLLTLALGLLFFGLAADNAFAKRSILGAAFNGAAIGWLSVLTLCTFL